MSTGTDPVLVTGLGATTPLGGDAKTTWARMLRGRSGAAALTEPWADSLPPISSLTWSARSHASCQAARSRR